MSVKSRGQRVILCSLFFTFALWYRTGMLYKGQNNQQSIKFLSGQCEFYLGSNLQDNYT